MGVSYLLQASTKGSIWYINRDGIWGKPRSNATTKDTTRNKDSASLKIHGGKLGVVTAKSIKKNSTLLGQTQTTKQQAQLEEESKQGVPKAGPSNE
eukprot:2919205-Amphidinium_carterae.1